MCRADPSENVKDHKCVYVLVKALSIVKKYIIRFFFVVVTKNWMKHQQPQQCFMALQASKQPVKIELPFYDSGNDVFRGEGRWAKRIVALTQAQKSKISFKIDDEMRKSQFSLKIVANFEKSAILKKKKKNFLEFLHTPLYAENKFFWLTFSQHRNSESQLSIKNNKNGKLKKKCEKKSESFE